jgi:sulfur carrier protein ThiS
MATNINVNGVLVGYPAGSTISDVVARLAVMSRSVVVRHNDRAVPIPEFAHVVLSEDDTVDVRFGGRTAELKMTGQ